MILPNSLRLYLVLIGIVSGAAFLTSCKHKSTATTAFYYWKTTYPADQGHQKLLTEAGNSNLYLRLFDIHWNAAIQQVRPDAVVKMGASFNNLKVTPVIYITNQTFKHTLLPGVDSLAYKSAMLVKHLTQNANIKYQQIQIDCDWTDDTRDKYFAYLTAFKRYDAHLIEATIRLHQVKYRERTGVPPVDRGVLMFYNMGSITATGKDNSIYNEKDAAKYLNRLGNYPLTLDIALPLFSWAIHSRNGRVENIYPQINRQDLTDEQKFKPENDYYKAVTSFYTKGIYVRENDIFKLEKVDAALLKKCATQLTAKLRPLTNRTIIFYELANVNLSEFDAQTFSDVTDCF